MGWNFIGKSSPYFSLKSAVFFRMVGSSSQCAAIKDGNLEKNPSNVTGLSTSRLPVDEPMKIFNPQTFLTSVFKTSSRLSLDAPI
jgi:hypothetical protein